MPKLTKQQELCNAFLKLGYKENTHSRTSKYRVFPAIHPGKEGYNFYVGSAGALRWGKTVSDSISCSESAKKAYISKASII